MYSNPRLTSPPSIMNNVHDLPMVFFHEKAGKRPSPFAFSDDLFTLEITTESENLKPPLPSPSAASSGRRIGRWSTYKLYSLRGAASWKILELGRTCWPFSLHLHLNSFTLRFHLLYQLGALATAFLFQKRPPSAGRAGFMLWCYGRIGGKSVGKSGKVRERFIDYCAPGMMFWSRSRIVNRKTCHGVLFSAVCSLFLACLDNLFIRWKKTGARAKVRGGVVVFDFLTHPQVNSNQKPFYWRSWTSHPSSSTPDEKTKRLSECKRASDLVRSCSRPVFSSPDCLGQPERPSGIKREKKLHCCYHDLLERDMKLATRSWALLGPPSQTDSPQTRRLFPLARFAVCLLSVSGPWV